MVNAINGFRDYVDNRSKFHGSMTWKKERKNELERERERKGLAQVGSWFHWGDKRPNHGAEWLTEFLACLFSPSSSSSSSSSSFLPQTGHVRTSTGSYIIKPAKPWRESDEQDSLEFSLEHAVQRIKPYTVVDATKDDDDDRIGAHNCGVIGEFVIQTFELLKIIISEVHCFFYKIYRTN